MFNQIRKTTLYLIIFILLIYIFVYQALICENDCSSTCSRFGYRSDDRANKPTVYLITPTYDRNEQLPDLTRLSQTLLLVDRLHWFIIEDAPSKTARVTKFITNLKVNKIPKYNSDLKISHLNTQTPAKYKVLPTEPSWSKPRGVWQRNLALKYLSDHFLDLDRKGVIYFMDDDNTYDTEIFEQMRYTRRVSIWPVGLVGQTLVERPILNENNQVIKFTSIWNTRREYPIDMAAFATNLSYYIMRSSPKFYFDVPIGFQETYFLNQLLDDYIQLEPKADNCTMVYVWHTQTVRFRPSKRSASNTITYHNKMFEIINTIAEFIIIQFLTVISIITNIPKPKKVDLTSIDRISDNGIVFYLVIFLHLLYIFLLNYCIRWDRIDNFMLKKAIQINDVPFGLYKYLVIIYTNWRPRSGTRSKIFLQLHGELGQNTICCYLHNPFLPLRKLFVWGDISFFVINTANPLGDIQAITIGHDGSVDSSWFLSKVLVKDIQMNKVFRFFAHCWLLSDENNAAEMHSLVTLKPVDPSYVEPYGERLFQWVRRCYRERPLMSFFYLNLLTRHSRVTRLNITYFYIIDSMLVNMMYFDKRKDRQDLYEFAVKTSFKAACSFIVLLILYSLFDFECFTTHYPTKRQFNIRMVTYIIFAIIYFAQVITLLLYSTLLADDTISTLIWLGLFVLGLIQSEFLYSLIAAFGKSIMNTFFSKDPFQEEQARIIFTYRNKIFRKNFQ